MPRRPDPTLGRPLTAAERKRRQRERDWQAKLNAIGHEETASIRTLIDLIADLRRPNALEPGSLDAFAAHRAWKEIGKRMGWIRDGHIVDPDPLYRDRH